MHLYFKHCYLKIKRKKKKITVTSLNSRNKFNLSGTQKAKLKETTNHACLTNNLIFQLHFRKPSQEITNGKKEKLSVLSEIFGQLRR